MIQYSVSQKLLIILLGVSLGLAIGYLLVFRTPLFHGQTLATKERGSHQVIGFLPYWLLGKAKTNYASDISTLAYFSLSLKDDGTLRKLTNPQETEPGWYALSSGRFDPFLASAKANKVKLSLIVFSADAGTVGEIISDPVSHANNLITEVMPVMKKYGFTDLNLDMEYGQSASPAAQVAYTQFVRQLKQRLSQSSADTLTVEVSPADLIRPGLTDLKSIGEIADTVVLMTYDYHYAGSLVTGPVAPLGGAGVGLEYDTETAVQKALAKIPPKKIIVGIPLYGFEWETINIASHSAVIPGTGLTASNERVQKLLQTCATCSARLETDAQESYLIYKDGQTGTYHQIAFPNKQATLAKINYALQEKLGGIAVWALGYEGSSILSPLEAYKN